MKTLLSTFEIVDRKTGEVVKVVRGKWGSVFDYHPEYNTIKYQFRKVDNENN